MTGIACKTFDPEIERMVRNHPVAKGAEVRVEGNKLTIKTSDGGRVTVAQFAYKRYPSRLKWHCRCGVLLMVRYDIDGVEWFLHRLTGEVVAFEVG